MVGNELVNRWKKYSCCRTIKGSVSTYETEIGKMIMKQSKIETSIRKLEATDERQYMTNENYEVYEKMGAPIGAMSFHYHNFYEVIYVLEGEYSSLIENQTYHLRKGDFLLIDQNIMHKYHHIEKKHDSSRRIILWVTAQMLAELSKGEMDLAACFTNRKSCAYHFPIYYEEMLRGYLLKLAMSDNITRELPGAKQVLDRGYLLLFFGYLNTLCSNKDYLFTHEDTIAHPLVELVNHYIDEHISEKITIEDLAMYVHMSKYHFLRKFKELTGVTAHSFITDKRLIRACEELRSGKNITMAYQTAGFADYSSFLRNFKATYGVSPRQYMEY